MVCICQNTTCSIFKTIGKITNKYWWLTLSSWPLFCFYATNLLQYNEIKWKCLLSVGHTSFPPSLHPKRDHKTPLFFYKIEPISFTSICLFRVSGTAMDSWGISLLWAVSHSGQSRENIAGGGSRAHMDRRRQYACVLCIYVEYAAVVFVCHVLFCMFNALFSVFSQVCKCSHRRVWACALVHVRVAWKLSGHSSLSEQPRLNTIHLPPPFTAKADTQGVCMT